MLITPRVGEKSYKLAAGNVYVFDVPVGASKAEIIAQIEKQYDGVKVKDARMLVVKGKSKAVNRGKRARPGVATRKDTKKAYVTVSEGEIKIAAFEEINNQANKEAAEAAKTEKKDVTATASDQRGGKQSRSSESSSKSQESSKHKSGGLSLFTKKRTGRRGDK